MRFIPALLPVLVLAGGIPAGCALVTVPEAEPSWTDERMAAAPDREPPVFVPEIARPEYESWRMATAASDLADTRDVVISRAQLLELPPIDPLTYGQQAREQATPPPAPVRDN